MKSIINTQKFAVYAFFFSLNFETIDLFNLDINYLATKITVSLLLLVSIFNYKTLLSLKNLSKYLKPLVLYFVLLTVISYLNKNSYYDVFFDFPFFLNIVIFIILINMARIHPNILLKGLFVFAISTILVAFLFIINFYSADLSSSRYSIFGINANELGLRISISLFVIVTLLYSNIVRIGKSKYLLFLSLPLLFYLMIKTGSRVALISLVLGFFVFIYFNKSIGSLKKIKIILMSVVLFVAIWALFLKNSIVVERLINSVKDGDLSNRDLIWLANFDIIYNNSLWGVGRTGYATRIEGYFEGIASPHNVIIEILSYTGMIGLVVFSVFFYRLLKKAFKDSNEGKGILPLVLLVPIFGMILSGQIFEPKIVWIILAFVVSGVHFENVKFKRII